MNNLDDPYLSYLPRIHNCAGKPSRTLSGHVARVIALRLDLDTGANQLPGSIQVHTRTKKNMFIEARHIRLVCNSSGSSTRLRSSHSTKHKQSVEVFEALSDLFS